MWKRNKTECREVESGDRDRAIFHPNNLLRLVQKKPFMLSLDVLRKFLVIFMLFFMWKRNKTECREVKSGNRDRAIFHPNNLLRLVQKIPFMLSLDVLRKFLVIFMLFFMWKQNKTECREVKSGDRDRAIFHPNNLLSLVQKTLLC